MNAAELKLAIETKIGEKIEALEVEMAQESKKVKDGDQWSEVVFYTSEFETQPGWLAAALAKTTAAADDNDAENEGNISDA